MSERMKRLPPHVRSLIARLVSAYGPEGVVLTTTIVDTVRSSCPETITDRELEDAIAEEAIATGLAIHFNHT